MGRSLSPLLRQELANLDKDADSRKSAMKALKSYVKDLDSKAIPLFLAQVSESKETRSSGEYTISLYEVLARVHGRNIVPQIGNIMSTIIKTLSSSAGSFALHQACSKVVPAMARYGIDPSTPDNEKKQIISSICKPLSDVLMGFSENLSSGAALCLKALIESDNWKFASDEIANEVCLRVAGALEEKDTQTNSHMGLIMALAKHNSLIIEAYTRSLIRSGLEILQMDVTEVNSQKLLNVILMINTLMKCIDLRSFCSELERVISVMEKCYSDRLPFVRTAALEALQTARAIASENGLKFDGGCEENSNSITGSNFTRRCCSRRNLWGCVGNSKAKNSSRSPRFCSPESRTVDSFTESPISTVQSLCNFEVSRATNRRLWKNESYGVDVSLKDGFYSPICLESCGQMDLVSNCSNADFEHTGEIENTDTDGDFSETFLGFGRTTSPNPVTKSTSASPQRSHTLTIDDIKIFSTPRKLIRSLQDESNLRSELSERQNGRGGSPASNEMESSPMKRSNKVCISHNSTSKVEEKSSEIESVLSWQNDTGRDGELGPDGWACACPRSRGSESVSSTDDVCTTNNSVMLPVVGSEEKNKLPGMGKKERGFMKIVVNFVCSLAFIVLAILLSAWWVDNQECIGLVPT